MRSASHDWPHRRAIVLLGRPAPVDTGYQAHHQGQLAPPERGLIAAPRLALAPTRKGKDMIIDGIRYARKCTECGKGMNEGYVIENGCEYYCSDECLHKHVSPEEFLELFDDGEGDTYWTDWEDESEWDDEEEELAA